MHGLFANRLGIFLLLLLLLGGLLRAAPEIAPLKAWFDNQLQWLQRMPVTLFFPDQDNQYLIPVSRSLPANRVTPEALLQLLAESSAQKTNRAVDSDTLIQRQALWHSMQSLSIQAGLDAETLATATALGDQPSKPSGPDARLLYFYSILRQAVVATPVMVEDYQQALTYYLRGSNHRDLLGLPEDIAVLDNQYDVLRKNLSLNFSFTQSLRELATEYPESTRSLLIGLIATMTQFDEIDTVTLEFDGHSRLGLGQCASLIGTPQSYPLLINDERSLVVKK